MLLGVDPVNRTIECPALPEGPENPTPTTSLVCLRGIVNPARGVKEEPKTAHPREQLSFSRPCQCRPGWEMEIGSCDGVRGQW